MTPGQAWTKHSMGETVSHRRHSRSQRQARHRAWAAILTAVVLLAAGGCSSDRVETEEGTVFLSVTDFDGLPIRASVNATSLVQVEEFVIENTPRNPNAGVSDLMNVEMRSYEVVYSRADAGTRVPSPLVRTIFGVAPVNGEITYENLPVMSAEQLLNPPLSDLLIANGGVDTETGSQVITVEFRVRFFGRTIGGDDVATAPIRFDIEFIP